MISGAASTSALPYVSPSAIPYAPASINSAAPTIKKTKKKGGVGYGSKKKSSSRATALEDEVPCRACNPKNPDHASYPKELRKKLNVDEFQWEGIYCDHCLAFYHTGCVGLEPYETQLIEQFFCPTCQPTKGPSTAKQVLCPHRLEWGSRDPEEANAPTQVGTQKWMQVDFPAIDIPLPPRNMKGEYRIFDIRDGTEFMKRFKRDEEWRDVYLIKSKRGLGLQMPPPGFGIDEAIDILGPTTFVDTVDVHTQKSDRMSLGRYKELLDSPVRPRLYNILSLEVSYNKSFAQMITPPTLYSELSLAEKYLDKLSGVYHVERFCLFSMGGSFTDFHIDFGGSSVWYHVHSGKKVFFVVPPTRENLELYERYLIEQDEEKITFLGDLYLKKGQIWKVEIEEGQTLMMPAGWIHAVHTPVDSVVFGGNFLTHGGMRIQLEFAAFEQRNQIDIRFQYPDFERVLWLAAETLTDELREKQLPDFRIQGALALYAQLVKWNEESKRFVSAAQAQKILENLQKVLQEVTKQDQLPVPEHLMDRHLHVTLKERVEEEMRKKEEKEEKEKKKEEAKKEKMRKKEEDEQKKKVAAETNAAAKKEEENVVEAQEKTKKAEQKRKSLVSSDENATVKKAKGAPTSTEHRRSVRIAPTSGSTKLVSKAADAVEEAQVNVQKGVPDKGSTAKKTKEDSTLLTRELKRLAPTIEFAAAQSVLMTGDATSEEARVNNKEGTLNIGSIAKKTKEQATLLPRELRRLAPTIEFAAAQSIPKAGVVTNKDSSLDDASSNGLENEGEVGENKGEKEDKDQVFRRSHRVKNAPLQ